MKADENVQSLADLLDRVRQFGRSSAAGRPPFELLYWHLRGFAFARRISHPDEDQWFDDFSGWVASRFGFAPAHDCTSIIRFQCNAEAEELPLFLKYIDEFNQSERERRVVIEDQGVENKEIESIADLLESTRLKAEVLTIRPSVERLHSFLGGFALARRQSHPGDNRWLQLFDRWVVFRFEVSPTHDWASVIRFHCIAESQELPLFWKCYDEFKQTGGKLRGSEEEEEK